MLKLIVGLGNPSREYENTRHNAGFFVLDSLIQIDKNKWTKGKGPFFVNERPFENGKSLLVKPDVFMNESGRAVKAAMVEFNSLPDQILIVVDDVNLPLGKIRFRSEGSSGGHNGLESVIEMIGTANFPRLRLGVGAGNLSGQDLTDFVLGPFSKEDQKLLGPEIDQARDACLEWVRSDALTVMRRFN